MIRLLASAACVALLLGACATVPAGSEADATRIGEMSDARNRARIHTELASLYYGRGNMKVALEELGAAVAAEPDYAPAHSMYGLVYMGLRDNAAAETSFQRALQLAPNDGDINHNYGWFLCQTQREAESMKYFEQAVRNPLYARPWRTYSAAGFCALRMNRVQDAEGLFERALSLQPDEPTALLQLAQIRYGQGRMNDARSLVSRFNNVVSPTAESLWLALRIERRSGQRVAEQSYANQLRRRYPDSPEYQALLRGRFD